MWGRRDIERCALGVTFRVLDAIDIEIEPHVHEDSHLIFVLAGHYVTSAEGAPPVSSAPILVDNPAGTAHRDCFDGPGGRFVAINLPLEASTEGHARARRDAAAVARMARITQEIALEGADLPLEEVATGLLHRRLVTETERHRPAWVDRVFAMIMETPACELTVADLAREAQVHPVHVTRSFKRFFGRTAGEMLRARQFEKACEYLVGEPTGLAEIAADLGFCDQAHFTHFFRQRAGQTPAAYRAARGQV